MYRGAGKGAVHSVEVPEKRLAGRTQAGVKRKNAYLEGEARQGAVGTNDGGKSDGPCVAIVIVKQWDRDRG